MPATATPRTIAPAPAPAARSDEVEVAIVGSGFSGLAMALRLRARPRGLRHPRAGQRRGRHLARQHLPRLRLRRPSPPLLASRSRPTPSGATYSRQAEIRAYIGASPTASGSALTSASAARSRRPTWRERGASAGASRPPRHAFGAALLLGATAASSTRTSPRSPGLDQLRGQGLPLGPLGPRLRPRGKRVAVVGTGASAIQFVPKIQPERREAAPLPAHAAVDHAARRPPDQRLESALPALPGRPAGCARAGIYWARELVALRPARATAASLGYMESGRSGHLRRQVRRPGAAPQADAGLRHRLQADPALERLLPRAGPRQRRGRRPGVGEVRGTRSSQPTVPSARSTRSSSAPASTSPTCRSPSGSTARGGRTPAPRLWRQPRTPTAARRSPASRTCSCRSGPTPASATVGRVMIEPQVRYIIDAVRQAMREQGIGTMSVKSETHACLQRRDPATDARHGVDRGRLRQLVPRRERPQHLAVAGLRLPVPPRAAPVRPRQL